MYLGRALVVIYKLQSNARIIASLYCNLTSKNDDFTLHVRIRKNYTQPDFLFILYPVELAYKREQNCLRYRRIRVSRVSDIIPKINSRHVF